MCCHFKMTTGQSRQQFVRPLYNQTYVHVVILVFSGH